MRLLKEANEVRFWVFAEQPHPPPQPCFPFLNRLFKNKATVRATTAHAAIVWKSGIIVVVVIAYPKCKNLPV